MKSILIILSVAAWFSVGFSPFQSYDNTSYRVDTSTAKIMWKGQHLVKLYEHSGGIQLKSGSLRADRKKVLSGRFVINMSTIRCEDIKDEKDNAKLVAHLKGEDFFAVKEYPESLLVVKNAKNTSGNTYSVTADLTIKGVTKEILFDAEIQFSKDFSTLEVTAGIDIKRTDFKVMYGWSIENAILDDDFHLEIQFTAKR